MGLFEKFRKKKKDGALVEKKGADLPDKVRKREKKELTEAKRRQNELEKRQNPVYNEAYVPYLDQVEAEENVVKNRRYEAISKVYRTSKWIALSLFVLYAVLMLFTFRDEITVENFRYLMRNVDFGIDTAVVRDNQIVYSADDNNRLINFRDYIALYNNRQLTIYDPGGSIALSEKLDYEQPSAKTSEKYLLLYDKGGNKYSVYSYFSREKSDKLDYPISQAAMSDSGVYAIATKNRDYQGVIYIYNSSFNLMNSIMKNKSISAMDLSADGSELLVCAYYTDERGRDMTELTLLPTSANEIRLTLTIEDTVVYSCSYFESGFVLICGNSLRFYDSDGNLAKIYSYNNTGINKYVTGKNGVSLVSVNGNDNSLCSIEMLDTKGDTIFSVNVPSDYEDILMQDDFVYLLYRDKLVRVNVSGISEKELETPLAPIKLIFTDQDLFVCTATTAVIVKFDGDTEDN